MLTSKNASIVWCYYLRDSRSVQDRDLQTVYVTSVWGRVQIAGDRF